MARTLVEKRTDWAGIGFAVALSLVIVVPLLVVAIWSVTNVWRYPSVIPQEFGLKFWFATLSRVDVWSSITMSLTLTTVVTLLSCIICLPAAYAFARMDFPGRDVLFFSFLAGHAFPKFGLLVAIAAIFLQLNLIGTFWGVVLIQLVGTLLFKLLDARLVAGLVGVVTLLFLAQRMLFPPRPDHPPPPRWVGALLTVTAGFTSFISHAGGPPLNAYLIPLKLKPVVYTATVAFLFFFVNLSKWIPYAWLGLLDMRNLATSIVLLPLAPVGVFIGVRIARRINAVLFYRFIYAGMFLTGCKLVWDGFF